MGELVQKLCTGEVVDLPVRRWRRIVTIWGSINFWRTDNSSDSSQNSAAPNVQALPTHRPSKRFL